MKKLTTTEQVRSLKSGDEVTVTLPTGATVHGNLYQIDATDGTSGYTDLYFGDWNHSIEVPIYSGDLATGVVSVHTTSAALPTQIGSLVRVLELPKGFPNSDRLVGSVFILRPMPDGDKDAVWWETLNGLFALDEDLIKDFEVIEL